MGNNFHIKKSNGDANVSHGLQKGDKHTKKQPKQNRSLDGNFQDESANLEGNVAFGTDTGTAGIVMDTVLVPDVSVMDDDKGVANGADRGTGAMVSNVVAGTAVVNMTNSAIVQHVDTDLDNTEDSIAYTGKFKALILDEDMVDVDSAQHTDTKSVARNNYRGNTDIRVNPSVQSNTDHAVIRPATRNTVSSMPATVVSALEFPTAFDANVAAVFAL